MFNPRMNRRVLLLTACFAAFGTMMASIPGWATELSWRGTSKLVSSEGSRYRREGTAVFTNGEEAQLSVDGNVGPNSTMTNGTSMANAVYRFADGSGFTLHFVSIWNEELQRNAGIFADGVGRFAGMSGSATALGEAVATGPIVVVWTGSYKLTPK